MAEPRRQDAIQGPILHEYDGIEEADNQLPRWWLATFFLAIAFGAGYWFYFHGFGIGALPMQRYAAALAAAADQGGEVTDAMLASVAADPSAVAKGKEAYATNCVVCHGTKGEGKIGPNLTDPYWLHGDSLTAIYKTIDAGIAAKGMPAWGSTLGRGSVREITAYVSTLVGTNVPGKAPQGTQVTAEAAGDAGNHAEDGSDAEAEARVGADQEGMPDSDETAE